MPRIKWDGWWVTTAAIGAALAVGVQAARVQERPAPAPSAIDDATRAPIS